MSSRSSNFNFEPMRLAQELLALGNSKITESVAHQISLEIAQELKTRPTPQLSAEVISGMVAFKLKELGVLNSGKESTLSRKAPVQLPTLEKFLRAAKKAKEINTQVAQEQVTQETVVQAKQVAEPVEEPAISLSPPSPPRANLHVAPQGLQAWEDKLRAQGRNENPQVNLRQSFLQLAEKAAQAEQNLNRAKGSEDSTNTVAVEFFNTLANQEFYPHVPELLGPQQWHETGTGFVWIDLINLSLASQDQALVDVKKLWQQGIRVAFILNSPGEAAAFQPETLSSFLKDLLTAFGELPENIELPQPIGFYLWAPREETAALLSLLQNHNPLVDCQIFLGWSSQLEDTSLRQVQTLHHQITEQDWQVEWLENSSLTLELPRLGGGPSLSPYEVCQMGSLNLSVCTSGREVDFTKLRRILRTALHFLDNLIEVNLTPLEKITQRTRRTRKLGLGVMGWAEMLAKLGCSYDSPAALTLAKRVAAFIHQESKHASIIMAQQRGLCQISTLENPERHSQLNSIVPSSFLAQLAGVTAGILPFETLLSPEIDSKKLAVRPVIQKLALERGLWSSQVEADLIRWNSLQPSPEAPSPLKRLLLLQHEIPNEAICATAQIFQQHFDGVVAAAKPIIDWEQVFASLNFVLPEAIKETLEAEQEESLAEVSLELATNEKFEEESFEESEFEESEESDVIASEITLEMVPETITETHDEAKLEEAVPQNLAEEVENIVEAAEQTAEQIKEVKIEFIPTQARERPEILNSRTYQIATGYGPLKVTVGFDELGPYEVALQVDKAGSEASVQAETISRLATLLLSHNVSPKNIVEELSGIRSFAGTQNLSQEVFNHTPLSLADGLAQVLAKEIAWESHVEKKSSLPLNNSTQTAQEFLAEFEDEEDFTVIESIREGVEEVTEITERYERELLH